ncbi:MAG: outer membrane protein assembly factor BamB [Methylomonas sp.]|nr:MAG: outer membrane protein assembly factor BamB [Methylobacter sp.]PPD37126.1 MAG: outer membrane protein assembly factor BamB [Methylomonas sp.]
MRLSYFPLLVFLLLTTGCSSLSELSESVSGITDYFSGGEDNTDPPAALTELKSEAQIELLWRQSVGVGADGQTLKLVPAITGGKIYAADRAGLVQARGLTNGELSWEVETKLHFSAGPAVTGNMLVLASSDADVIALDAENGSTLWKTTVSSEVLSVPVIAKGFVVVRSTDGSVHALNERTGEKLWTFEQNIPALSVRGTGSLVIVDDKVIGGYDNGKLVALRLNDGKYLWESSVAIPAGRSEIERLVDLDADPVEDDGVIFIASYQSNLVAVSAVDGEVIWRNEAISSSTGISKDWRYLYVTDSKSDIWQIDQRSGASFWKQADLHQRKLTAPLAYDRYVVVGDLEGYVHWLAESDGRLLSREQVAKDPIDAKPLVFDETVYVYSLGGTLAALKAR